MFYKKIVCMWMCLLLVLLSAICFLSIVIDPVGIWNNTAVEGLNQYKSKQGGYLDVWKPYQYAAFKPDVVYIGSSRVYVGFFPDEKGKSVYNMGASSLSIKDMRKYLQFIYQVHKPKKIYVGLDFFQFGKENYHTTRNGFSEERLNNILHYGMKGFSYRIMDSMAFAKYIPLTIYESWKNRGQLTFWRGWDIKRGNAAFVNQQEYYGYLNSFTKSYEKWKYEPQAVADLQAIIDEAKQANVEIILFFNPLSVDLYALLDVNGRLDEFNQIKLQIAQITDVFDFAFINEMTTNRLLFYDASHYKITVGERIVACMKEEKEDDSYHLLKANDVHNIDEEKLAYARWKIKNQTYYEVLKNYHASKKAFAVYDLKEFIGW